MSAEEYIFGIHTVETLLDKNPRNIILLYVQQGRHDQRVQQIIKTATKHGVAIQEITRHKLDELLPHTNHQGIVARCLQAIPYTESDIEGILDSLVVPPFLLILDGVQDPHNLGACLRTANAAGVHLVVAPKDDSVGITPVVRKVACGAAEMTPFIQVTNLARTLRFLKDRGIWLFGAAGDATTSLYKADLKGSTALVLGAEGKGLRRLTQELCDYHISIPMLGTVESLNVSVATGVCLFEALRQRRE